MNRRTLLKSALASLGSLPLVGRIKPRWSESVAEQSRQSFRDGDCLSTEEWINGISVDPRGITTFYSNDGSVYTIRGGRIISRSCLPPLGSARRSGST